jgi:superfamily II DNA or RNA helicase
MSKKIDKDFSYPKPEDEDLLYKIFKKREFYYHRVPQRDIMKNYDDITKYRNNTCYQETLKPREQQGLLPNYINPNTPYKGILMMHGTGSGKSCTAIAIAETFKDQVKKYNTKIYILVPGPNTRENFKKELLVCTGDTYLKNKEELNQMSKADIEKEKKTALNNAFQYYKFLSYKTFYKKVLGEKIVEKKGEDKKSYRKNDKGEFEREIVVNRITNMDNSILIVEEAHNLSGNQWGEALQKIIDNSVNLKVILLTATPMINLADEIVDLLNFLRPSNDMIQRDKIFTSDTNYTLKVKPGGIEYLKEKARGYISYYRGNIPYTFAKRVEKGVIPSGLLMTPVVKCFMSEFQYNTYIETTKDLEDTLDRTTSAAANFVFPGLDKDRKKLKGYYSVNDLSTVLSQINTDGALLKSLINKNIFNNKLSKTEEDNFIMEGNNKNITGLILKLKYIRHFSVKFYKMMKRLNKLVDGLKGPKTAFVYSNLVNAGGMELFAEALIQNGYHEYMENPKDYDIKDDSIDYKTGLTFIEYKKKYNANQFKPATFLLITGSGEDGENIPEIKQNFIQDVYNNVDNIDGKHIKLLLGTRVMNEGINLKNCNQVHILDVFFNIPRAEQVIGRAIRMCVHMDSIKDSNRFPKVYVYRYVVALLKELSTDELLYQKAELKYLIVKQIERALKEVALDCPLLLHANVFPEELEKYKDCVEPTLENVKLGKQLCPALCDFRKCDLKCDSKKLDTLWDAKNKTYKMLEKKDIDYNTYNDMLARYEIIVIKNKIKDLYRFKHTYTYDEILDLVKDSLLDFQNDLFDEYFLDQALQDLMPKNENDFNNFKDTIYDKYNKSGYLIQRDKYYIFQPFNENENVSMYYRENAVIDINNMVSLNNYIKENYPKVDYKDNTFQVEKKVEGYNFESVMEYYQDRDENFIVGIIDKNYNKLVSDDIDIFKIRDPRAKTLDKKRGTGIPTFKGAVCSSKDKEDLMKIIKKLHYTSKEEDSISKMLRGDICLKIKEKLLYLEKYTTSKDGNKKTYVMIPSNHPVYPFPYNLEDRLKFKISKINKIVNKSVYIPVVMKKDNNIYYIMSFDDDKLYSSYHNKFKEEGFILKDSKWEHYIQ